MADRRTIKTFLPGRERLRCMRIRELTERMRVSVGSKPLVLKDPRTALFRWIAQRARERAAADS